MTTYKPIRDYAIIGNRRSAALVAKDGTIDWATAPFLDSPSVFGALLDYTKGGFWAIQPVEDFESEQEYVWDTNILITRFTTAQGVLEITDCMPIHNQFSGANNNGQLGSFELEDGVKKPVAAEEIFEIYRKIRCVKGRCRVKVFFQPRFNYARGKTVLSLIEGGVVAENGHQKGVLVSKANYEIQQVDPDIELQDRAVTHIELAEGQQHYLSFRYNTTEIPGKTDDRYEYEIQETKQFWEEWVTRWDFETSPLEEYPWEEPVSRSSLVLKILFAEPPGSIAAAATTSLPEEIGSGRNWDYRFSWLRDSAFTLQAMLWLGYLKEADQYMRWLVHECRSAEDGPEKLQIMYGLRGQRELEEQTLDHLDGYMGSKPVRIGNGAYNQRQLDVYGSILNVMWRLHRMRNDYELSPQLWEALRSFANYVVQIWREPDEGMWEVRGGMQHFVYSKVMCWVALDRALKLAEAYEYECEQELWKKERDEIKKEILEKGWSESKQSFTLAFGSNKLDCAALLMPVLGFIQGDDPKMLATIQAVEKELSVGDGLYRRYTDSPQDGMPGGEGAFLLCSFWMVDALIFAGQKERAQKLFDKLLGYRNHLGLYSEEIDPKTKEFLGNYPQAFTHIGLINSAFYLSFDKETLRKVVS